MQSDFHSFAQTNTFQVILVTDGFNSYTIFTYQCGLLQWSGGATIGFIADDSFFQNHPLSGSSAANIACVNIPATIWSNVVYQLNPPPGKYSFIRDPKFRRCIIILSILFRTDIKGMGLELSVHE